MPRRRRYVWTEKRIEKFIGEGRGTGTGPRYKPWLTVADVPSIGRSHRIFWPTSGRQHHFLSDLEYYAFLHKCFDDNTLDIREQFPLPRQETLAIAAALGVRHPRAHSVNIVMTTDLLVTRNGPIDRAYAVKPNEALLDERTMEKLEIERVYWERRGVKWAIIPGSCLRDNVTMNLEWIFDCLRDCDKQHPEEPVIKRHLIEEIKSLRDFPLRVICGVVDGRLDLDPGQTLGVARRMLSQKIIVADLSERILPDLVGSRFTILRDR